MGSLEYFRWDVTVYCADSSICGEKEKKTTTSLNMFQNPISRIINTCFCCLCNQIRYKMHVHPYYILKSYTPCISVAYKY